MQEFLQDSEIAGDIPLSNWDQATFDKVAESLESNFHIPRSWFDDLLEVDAIELAAGTSEVVALALHWNREDTETFANLVGSAGVSAAFASNPLLIVVSVVALAKAFHRARENGEYAEPVGGQFKSAAGTGATLSAVALVGVAGGPAGVALLAGFAAGMLANKAAERVSVFEIGQFMAEQAISAADEALQAAARQASR